MHCAWLSDCKCISKKASSLSIPIFFPFLTSLYVKQLDLLLDAATLCFYFVMMALLHAGRTLDLHGPVLTAAAANPLYAHFCPTRSPFLYFKWQRCRTSLLIFSFFILSPSLLCVCTSFPTSQCLFYVFWNYFSFGIHIWRMGSTRHLVIMSPLNLLISLLLCVTVGTTSMVTSPPSCACRPILFVVSGLCRRSLVPCPSLQHWDQGGGNSEEPERLIAHTGLQAGPQSALLSAPSGPEPKPAHRLGVPQHSLPAGQTPLQLSLRPPSFIFLSLSPSLQLSQHFLSLFIFTFSSCGWGVVCIQRWILSGSFQLFL